MKKITSLSIVLAMAILALPTGLQASVLSDISSHKNRTAIEYLNQNGIVQGYEDGTYKPDASINRAEFTKIIIEATYDSETIEGCLPQQMKPNWTYTFFPDVDRNAWYAKYICVAKINNIVSGYEDGLFRPENEINKAEAIKILVTSQGYTIPESVTGNTYSDVMNDDWFAPYVKAAFDANLIEDTGSAALSPGQALTRAGMSEMTYRTLVSEGGAFVEPETSNESGSESENAVSEIDSNPQESEKESWEITGTYYAYSSRGSALYFRTDDDPDTEIHLQNAELFLNDQQLYTDMGLEEIYEVNDPGCSSFWGKATLEVTDPQSPDESNFQVGLVQVIQKESPTCGPSIYEREENPEISQCGSFPERQLSYNPNDAEYLVCYDELYKTYVENGCLMIEYQPNEESSGYSFQGYSMEGEQVSLSGTVSENLSLDYDKCLPTTEEYFNSTINQ